jgi:hypothetical protein
MKSTVLLFFALTTFSAHSQTLTCADNCPQPSLYSMKSSSPVVHTGGQNQVWNFSVLQAVSPPFTATYNPFVPAQPTGPQTIMLSSIFQPTAYLQGTATGLRELLANDNSAIIMRVPYPFSYGNTYIDSATFIAPPPAFISGASYHYTLTAFGTGTLILPNSSYKNVLSVKFQSIQTTTINGVVSPNKKYTTAFYYYTPGILHHLMYGRTVYETGPNPTDYGPYTEFISEQLTGIASLQDKAPLLSLSPNPCSSLLQVPEGYPAGSVSVRNLSGQIVLQSTYDGSALKVDLKDLTNGLYFLSLSDGQHSFSQKITVLHD